MIDYEIAFRRIFLKAIHQRNEELLVALVDSNPLPISFEEMDSLIGEEWGEGDPLYENLHALFQKECRGAYASI